MRVLVVAAHPDDEVLGCGGTIARLASEGHHVEILILGEGISSRNDSSNVKDQQDELYAQSRSVADYLGAAEVGFSRFPDNRFDSIPLLDIVQSIETVVRRVRPELVYTQSGGDLNIDHQITFKATMAAVRPMQGSSVKALYAYEVPSSTEWAFSQFAPKFAPNIFVDITAFLEKKQHGLNIYSSEIREFPHPRSSRAVRVYAEKWGAAVGVEAAEPFQTIFEKV